MSDDTRSGWSRLLPAVAAAAVFIIALTALYRLSGEFDLDEILAAARNIPARALVAGLAFTVASYVALTLYDVLALRHVGRSLPYRRAAATSFVAYAVGHNVGVVAFSAGAIRYRLYSLAGLSATDIGQIVACCAVTFNLGAGLLIGISLVAEAGHAASLLHASPALAIGSGSAILLALTAYLALTAWRREPLTLGRWTMPLPAFKTTLGQLTVSVADLILACAALYVLLPPDAGVSFVAFTGLYMVALVAGAISTVPGGLGVFESLLLLLLPAVPAQELLGALLAYRVLYYVLPFAVAMAVLVAYELWQQRARVRVALHWTRRSLDFVVPQAMSVLAFGAGVILLLSGATPAIAARIAALEEFLPLSVLEISHLAGSAIGVALLVLARGLYYRLDAAWHLMVWLLCAGIVASLLKGLDYEEALILCLVLLPLLATRREFYRRASLLAEPLAPRWLAAVAIAIGASIWIGLIAHRAVPYQRELWWQFAFDASAPRMLRASLVAVLGLGVAAAYRLLQPPRPRAATPSDGDLEQAAAIAQTSGRASANLVLLGDKNVLFSASGASFVMYGMWGRSWVAMGDPVGPAAERGEMVWRFREICDREGVACVFYEVDAANLPALRGRGPLPEQDRRRGAGGAARFLAGGPHACAAAPFPPPRRKGGRVLPGRDARGSGTAHAQAARGFRAMADREGSGGKRLLAGLLRRILSCTLPVRPRGSARAYRRVRQYLGERAGQGIVHRPDALLRRRSEGSHGVPLRRVDALGQGARIRVVQPRHGAARGTGASPPGAALAQDRTPGVPLRRELLQLRGPPSVQGEVPSAVGAALPRRARRHGTAAGAARRDRAHRARSAAESHSCRAGAGGMRQAAAIAALLVLSAVAAAAGAAETTLEEGRLGTVTLYEPASAPKELVLFISGDGGWISGVIEMAGHFAEEGALVAGIDINHYGKALRESGGCMFSAGELEQFAHDLERRYHFATYVNPILVGYSSGATLAYTTLVQSPPGTFKGALSLGFCPDLPWDKPMCPGDGPGLAADRGTRGGYVFHPTRGLKDPWIVIQGSIDQVCSAAVARRFAGEVSGAELIELPKVGHGFSVERNYVPQMLAAYRQLASVRSPPAAAPDAGVSGLPLVEVPASGKPRDLLAVMLSGDGGWAGLDREVADVLTTNGVAVVGWDSLRYFWHARTPDVAAADLARIITHYTRKWGKSRVITVGYSLGADTMPFMVNRLPADARDRIALVALLGPGREAFFEFHVSLWLGKAGGGLPLAPEMARLDNANVLCIYGAEEKGSACEELPDGANRLRLPGGHHFDGNYEELGRRILQAVK